MSRRVVGVAVLSLLPGMAKAIPWFPFGPDGGDARSLAADPRDHAHLYAGTATGWIYETHDGGRGWKRLVRIGQRDDLVLDNIAVDAADSKHLLVGARSVGEPDGGIFVSRDGGVSWASVAEMKGQAVLALAQSASKPKVWVAGTLTGVEQSEDNGAHWRPITPPGSTELHEVESVAIDPTNPKVIYAGTWHLPWKTVDGGATWNNIKEGVIDDSDVFSIIVDPVNPQTVYASACSGIYKSEDAGGRFHKVEGIPAEARRTRVLMQDPKNRDVVFAGTTEGLFRTGDGGKIWIRVTGSDVIVNDVFIDPKDTDRILLATDRSGILASNDGGASFQASMSGFSARHLSAYVQDAKHPATVYVGMVNDKQWGGVFRSENGGLSWVQESDGLEGSDIFSLGQTADGTVVSGTGHGIYRLKDGVWGQVGIGGAVVKAPALGSPGPRRPAGKRGAKPAPVRASGAKAPATPRVAAASAKAFDAAVYAFSTQGQGIYAATGQGLLVGSADGGSWKTVMAGQELFFLGSAGAEVVAAGRGSIFLTRDGGGSWKTVAPPPGLTQLAAVAVDGEGRLWAGGREGAFFSENDGGAWQTLNGLGMVNVNSLYFDGRSQRLFVTNAGASTTASAVQLPAKKVSLWDTGWNLRFVRPIGDHLIGITPFDGVVVQPRMVDSAESAGP